MADTIPFRLSIDHDKKRLRITVEGADGSRVTTSMDCDQIAEFMAILSQCQHALVLSHAGQKVTLPMDPSIAFETIGGRYALDYFEVHRRHSLGIDSELGAVGMKLLSRKGRLTSIRMSPEAARKLGSGLVQMADEVPRPQPKQ
jgi:hypothetical protein